MKVTKKTCLLVGCVSSSWLFLNQTHAAPGPATEAATELDLFKLDALVHAAVVTASGGEQEDRSTAAATVYVLSGEEIVRRGFSTVAEALASVPGFHVIDDLVQPALSVRGLHGGLQAGTRLIRVMIDGNTVAFRPEQSAFLGFEFVPLDAIERIEVAKGPLSAVYGTSAFLATVNVITRRSQTGTSAQLSASLFGSRSPGGYGSAVVRYGNKHGFFSAAVLLGHLDRSGLPKQPTLFPQERVAVRQPWTENDVSAPISALLSAGLVGPRLGELTLQAGVQRLDSVAHFRFFGLSDDRNRVALANFFSRLRYQKIGAGYSVSAHTSFHHGKPLREHELSLSDDPGSSYTANYGYTSMTQGLEAGFRPLGPKLSVRIGGEFEYARERVLYYTQHFYRDQGRFRAGDSVDLIGEREREVDYLGGAASLSLSSAPFTKKWAGLRLGFDLRLDKIRFGPVTYEPQASFRGSLAYRFSSATTAKLVAGRAFQMPAGVLLFSEGGFGTRNQLLGAYVHDPSKPLGPQRIYNIEATLSSVLFRHWVVEASAYSQSVLEKVEFAKQGDHFIGENSAGRSAVGFEIQTRLLLGRFSLQGWLAGLFEIPFRENMVARNPPPLFPNWQGLIGADLDLPELWMHLNVQTRFIGTRGASDPHVQQNGGNPYTLPAYAALDVNVSTQPLAWPGPETRLILAAHNLLLQKAVEPGQTGFDLPTNRPTIQLLLKQCF